MDFGLDYVPGQGKMMEKELYCKVVVCCYTCIYIYWDIECPYLRNTTMYVGNIDLRWKWKHQLVFNEPLTHSWPSKLKQTSFIHDLFLHIIKVLVNHYSKGNASEACFSVVMMKIQAELTLEIYSKEVVSLLEVKWSSVQGNQSSVLSLHEAQMLIV